LKKSLALGLGCDKFLIVLGANMINNNNDAHIYKILHFKKEMAERGGCDRCPPHRKENGYSRVPRRSWKLRTRNNRQYKNG
jgi:hypothetical protein